MKKIRKKPVPLRVGDVVCVPKWMQEAHGMPTKGTICYFGSVSVGVRIPGFNNGHDCGGACGPTEGWWMSRPLRRVKFTKFQQSLHSYIARELHA